MHGLARANEPDTGQKTRKCDSNTTPFGFFETVSHAQESAALLSVSGQGPKSACWPEQSTAIATLTCLASAVPTAMTPRSRTSATFPEISESFSPEIGIGLAGYQSRAAAKLGQICLAL